MSVIILNVNGLCYPVKGRLLNWLKNETNYMLW